MPETDQIRRDRDRVDPSTCPRRHEMQTIEIVVSPTGETRVETKGFTGSSCRDASSFVEDALGRRTSEQLTAEFYQAPPTQQSEQP